MSLVITWKMTGSVFPTQSQSLLDPEGVCELAVLLHASRFHRIWSSASLFAFEKTYEILHRITKCCWLEPLAII